MKRLVLGLFGLLLVCSVSFGQDLSARFKSLEEGNAAIAAQVVKLDGISADVKALRSENAELAAGLVAVSRAIKDLQKEQEAGRKALEVQTKDSIEELRRQLAELAVGQRTVVTTTESPTHFTSSSWGSSGMMSMGMSSGGCAGGNCSAGGMSRRRR